MSGFLSEGIQPSLIHAVDVKIQRLNKEVTNYDDDFREPAVQAQYKAPEEVICQVHYVDFDKMNMDRGGDLADADGWLTFLKADLDEMAGGYFKKSDKIVEIDGQPVEFYIQDIDRKGHYREARLIKFYFKDRDTGFGG